MIKHDYIEVTHVRITPFLATLALLLSLACKSPEFKEFKQSPPMIDVTVSILDGVGDVSHIEKEVAAALRARLATLVMVVPDGTEAPPDAVNLLVEIDQIKRGKVSPVAAGATAGVAVTMLGAAVGGRHNATNIIDGLFYGLWVGSEVAANQRHQASMLGYVPPRVKGMITLTRPEYHWPIMKESIKPRSVINEMTPLDDGDQGDIVIINEKIARAIARTVTNKLQAKFDWQGNAAPTWYRPVEE